MPALLLSCVHLSGDSILEGRIRPAGIFLNEVQGFMSVEDQAPARKIALDVIGDYRDPGCLEPKSVDAGQLKRTMDWLVCAGVREGFIPMMLEEIELDGRDARVTQFHSSPEARAAFPVVVGFSSFARHCRFLPTNAGSGKSAGRSSNGKSISVSPLVASLCTKTATLESDHLDQLDGADTERRDDAMSVARIDNLWA